MPQSSFPTLPYPRSWHLAREALWTPLLLCPPSQPQPTHLACARFLPSTCLQSFRASSKTDPCTTNHLSWWGGISCLDSHLLYKLRVSLSFLVHTDCYGLTGNAGLLPLKECKAGELGAEGKEMELTGGELHAIFLKVLNFPQPLTPPLHLVASPASLSSALSWIPLFIKI